MKFSLPMTFLLALDVVRDDLDDDCSKGGCPCDYEPIEDPVGSGNIMCRKVELLCPGTDRDYYYPGTDAMMCCAPTHRLIIYDEGTREGVCCGPGEVYVGQQPHGKCCGPGQVLKDGECADPEGIRKNGHTSPRPTQSQDGPSCALRAVCGDSKTNGLNYGKCYQITMPGGQQLGRGVPGAWDRYAQDGFVQDIPFKICKSVGPDGCGDGPVGSFATFFIEDSLGGSLDASGQQSWMDNAANFATISLTTNPNYAGRFSGSSTCARGECVIRLNGLSCAPSGQARQPSITFLPNRKIALALQFSEVPCNGDFFDFSPDSGAGSL